MTSVRSGNNLSTWGKFFQLVLKHGHETWHGDAGGRLPGISPHFPLLHCSVCSSLQRCLLQPPVFCPRVPGLGHGGGLRSRVHFYADSFSMVVGSDVVGMGSESSF